MPVLKLLLLEDDAVLAAEVQLFLVNNGYSCDIAVDGGLLFKQNLRLYDLFLLDINVPTFNGMKVLRKIRETDEFTPVLMLTAYGAVTDKVKAMELGCDDYLVKPFHFDELLARIKVLLKRNSQQRASGQIYSAGDLFMYTAEMNVTRGGREIHLTRKEYKLLELLFAARGRVVSKQVITAEVWGENMDVGSNTVEVYINFLRNKIDRGFSEKLIHTRQGFGYFLKKIE